MSTGSNVVNAFTEWGNLETIVVGNADPKSCHAPHEPAEINDAVTNAELGKWVMFPEGQVKHPRLIKEAQAQLDNLAEVLMGEKVHVQSGAAFDADMQREVDKKRTTVKAPTGAGDDVRIVQKPGAKTVHRPDPMDWTQSLKTPGWSIKSQFCSTCPRDTMITLGNTILTATMSHRSRYFEYLSHHRLALALWRADPMKVKYVHAPKPSMNDDMYDASFHTWSEEERYRRMPTYHYTTNELEPVFDAADMIKVGKDVFIHNSMVTNVSGSQWLTSHFPEFRFHAMHCPFDMHPLHIDASFLPLRPPTAGSNGLCIVNPERPLLESQAKLWWENGWEFVVAPQPAVLEPRPLYSCCSAWLSMNLMSVSPKCVVIEENEVPLYNALTDLGLDVITVPMRFVSEFGGGIHCATWDIKREDGPTDYFPSLGDSYEPAHMAPGYTGPNDVECVDVTKTYDGKVHNPAPSRFSGGTLQIQRQIEKHGWPPKPMEA